MNLLKENMSEDHTYMDNSLLSLQDYLTFLKKKQVFLSLHLSLWHLLF